MARMYSGKRGKSGSKKPLKKTAPSWVRLSAKEAEMLIVKMAKEGMHFFTEQKTVFLDYTGARRASNLY